MEISKEQINAAYAVADENTRKVLDALFGEQKDKDSRPVTERIKTFEDAVKELGEDNVLVQAYNTATFDTSGNCGDVSDVIAYLKLRIIVAALNEGWTPQFTEDEYRWFSWYILWTQSEYDELSEERKAKCRRLVYRSSSSAGAHGGVAYAAAFYGSAHSGVYIGSRLVFRTKELAIYAGEQFMDIYAQWLGFELNKIDK